MSISLEQIDLLRKRANVSYEEAKEALEKNNNDIVEALIYLEQQKKTNNNKQNCCDGKFMSIAKKILHKGNTTRFIVEKQKSSVINVPLTAAAIFALFAAPFFVLGIVIALFTNHKIRLQREDGVDLKINKIFDKMSSAANDVASQFKDEDFKK